MTFKIVITSGCSFSDPVWERTWPVHLGEIFPDVEHRHTGLGSTGNGLISRKVIYEVAEALKLYKPEDILVGVMWSGRDRHDVYLQETPRFEVDEGWRQNPTAFVKNSDSRWVLLNWFWKNTFAKQYYTHYHDNIGSQIYTIEHVLRVQWFLQLHGIPYFMSTFTNEVFDKGLINHIDVEHLYKQINFENFLPIEGKHEWARDHSGLAFDESDPMHPSPAQHKKFTDNVIIPFLQNKKYI